MDGDGRLAWEGKGGDSFVQSISVLAALQALVMLAQPFAIWLQQRGIHYAWIVMAVVFLAMLVSAAALGLPGAFLGPLHREYGWSIAEISSALAIRFVLYGLIGPFVAILLERYGARRIV